MSKDFTLKLSAWALLGLYGIGFLIINPFGYIITSDYKANYPFLVVTILLSFIPLLLFLRARRKMSSLFTTIGLILSGLIILIGFAPLAYILFMEYQFTHNFMR